jgi:type I restriction enzyme, S subunit
MSEWKTVEIGEVCKVGDGAHSKVQRTKNGVMYLTAKNFSNGNLKLENIDFISKSDYERLFSKKSKAIRRPQYGDVLMGIIGSFGNGYKYKKTDDFGVSSSVSVLRPNPSILDSDFLTHVINSPLFKYVHEAYSSGTAQGYSNIPTIKSMPIVLPPICEQKKIVAVFSSIDSKIDHLRRQNQALENIAQTLFKRWFIDFEFPDKDGKPYKSSGGKMVESELGEIPDGWRSDTISSIILRITTKVGNKCQDEFKVLSAVKTGELVLSEEYFTKQVFSKNISKYITIEKNDFAYNPARINIGSIGKFEKNLKGAVSPVYVAFRCKEHYHNFVSFLLRTVRAKKHIEQLANGSVRQTLNYDDFAMMEIVSPKSIILDTFNCTYLVLKSKKDSNSNQIQILKKARDTLLPKLMSGQIRVKSL